VKKLLLGRKNALANIKIIALGFSLGVVGGQALTSKHKNPTSFEVGFFICSLAKANNFQRLRDTEIPYNECQRILIDGLSKICEIHKELNAQDHLCNTVFSFIKEEIESC
jgi:hypothetical protein